MKEQQYSSQETEARTQNGESSEESLLKERITRFSQKLGVELTKELALWMIYGDAPREDWEMPIPQWVENLPKGELLQEK